MKFCKKCNAETERYASGDCKPCKRAMSVAYRLANPTKSRDSVDAWVKANKELSRETKKAWYITNKARCRSAAASYYQAHKERFADKNAKWGKANPEAVRIISHTYRAKKRANGGKLSKGLSAKLFKLQRGLCPCCQQPLGADFHLDHIMPLSLGGMNIDSNIQLLRQSCNQQKSAKHPVEFMQSRGFLI